MPRFVFWDCDNTLIENASLHWQKHKEICSRHGYDLPDKFRVPLFLNNGQQNWEWLVKNLGLHIPLDDYLMQIDTWYHSHIHQIPLRSGVPWALNYFKTKGLKQCVVTNARRASVEPMLHVQNIFSYFEFTWCKEDYSARKPSPIPYITAIENMERLTGEKIDRADCLAIEDAPEGVTAAHLAGIKVIQRRYTHDENPSHDSDISVYDEADFIEIIKNL